MQCLRMRPGPLAPRVVAAPGFARPALEYDDHNLSLVNGPALARLTRLEYVLIMALLRQRQHWEETPEDFALCCEVSTLCEIANSTSEQSVHRRLNSAGMKVKALGIRVVRLYAEDTYMILFDSEIKCPKRQEAPLLVVS